MELYPAMQLGGTPPQLIDQVKDGRRRSDLDGDRLHARPLPIDRGFRTAVHDDHRRGDVARIPRILREALRQGVRGREGDRLAWHGPGLIHSKKPVAKLEDMRGVKIRGGSRVINQMLEKLGAIRSACPFRR